MAVNGLRRVQAVHSSLGDETKTQFLIAKRALPRDEFRDAGNMRMCEVSLPRVTGPGPGIERADREEEEEQEVICRTVASVPIDDADMVYSHLLQLNQCYQAMAKNNKVIVFTDDMPVRKAFYALIYNSTRTGLVTDSSTFKLSGVLSATDFIMVLMKLWRFRSANSRNNNKMTTTEEEQDDISNIPIRKWKEHLQRDGRLKPFQTIDVEDSLYAAAERLSSSRIHRLPVLDHTSGDCMFIITHRRLLHFIWTHAALLPKPDFLRERVQHLGVGTWSNIHYVTEETPLIDALDVLMNKGISGVPVVKDVESLEVMSVYTRFDAISVAFEKDEDELSKTVGDALSKRKKLTGRVDFVVTVPEEVNLWSLLECFVEKNVYRVFAVDGARKLKGLISLSDLINFIVLRPKTTDI